MFTKQIEIIDIGAPTTVSTGKKPYHVIEVAFKEDGKVGGKKLLSFTNEQVFKDIQQYKRGDVLTITTEKDKNDYWQWTSISVGGSTPAAASAGSASADKSTGRVTGSNYETAEERKVKQLQIRRQSCLGYALSFAELAKMAKPSVQGIIAIAQEFEAFVASPPDALKAVADMDDDIPV